jgi:hypothetical protein
LFPLQVLDGHKHQQPVNSPLSTTSTKPHHAARVAQSCVATTATPPCYDIFAPRSPSACVVQAPLPDHAIPRCAHYWTAAAAAAAEEDFLLLVNMLFWNHFLVSFFRTSPQRIERKAENGFI